MNKKKLAANIVDSGGHDYDFFLEEDMLGKSYVPPMNPVQKIVNRPREANPVVFLEIYSAGGRRLRNGNITPPQDLGKMFFELRYDIVPVACANFEALITGANGVGKDGIKYHFKGVRIHRIIKNLMFQCGDLLDERGNCSRSIYNNGGVFRDENFILRHAGAGCLSMCNRGPDTNGSLFQVSFTQNSDLDGTFVVFGCLCNDESYDCLENINMFGSSHGEPIEELRIVDCGIAYPNPLFKTTSTADDDGDA